MVLRHQGWSDQAWKLSMTVVRAEAGLSSTIYLAYALYFSIVAPSLPPTKESSLFLIPFILVLILPVVLLVYLDVLPTCCPLCLSCPLSSSFLSPIHPTCNNPRLSLSLGWSCWCTWGKTVVHCVWLCHRHVTKRLNTVAGYMILVLIFIIKAS